MRIAVLSGKGGTGKTTVAVNLAAVWGCRYVDCDVEAPNGFFFLKPHVEESWPVEVREPVIAQKECTLCSACVAACQFHALAKVGKTITTFPKLCHGCGLCAQVCPAQAISEQSRAIGLIEYGTAGNIECWRGVLDVGEPMAGPVIEQLKSKLDDKLSILDCPPGSSCSVVKAAGEADLALLVTEPTPFGLHDLKIAVALTEALEIPAVIVINRSDEHADLIEAYAQSISMAIVAKLPFSRSAAEVYAHGGLLIEQPEWMTRFVDLGSRVQEVVACNS